MQPNMGRRFSPPVDLIELADRLLVRVEIAAMSPDDFNITLTRQQLLISGERRLPDFEQPAAYHRVEIPGGEFRLEIALPRSVDREAVQAGYQDGLLQVELPLLPEKRVPIVDVSDKGLTHDE